MFWLFSVDDCLFYAERKSRDPAKNRLLEKARSAVRERDMVCDGERGKLVVDQDTCGTLRE